ncbi:inner centromere protein A-like [Cydia amplana]|uniref:inner centromere protein A-like n=1 Tax=Cydia amplana TaxID=1869771 RepID=UPI002FE66FAD
MPARTRTVRAPKASKENVDNLLKNKAKNTGQVTKPARKPLADKTNSASDENTSPEPVKKVIKTSSKPIRKPSATVPVTNDENRPRRNRRLPPRYVENEVLNKLSNSKENAVSPTKSLKKTPVKSTVNVESPFKTPTTVLDNSLLANRPKRVSRLPSKFDENSSPNKFVPTHCHTSTPLVSKAHEKPKDVRKAVVGKQKQSQQQKIENAPLQIMPRRVSPRKGTLQKASSQNTSSEKATSRKVTPQKSPQNQIPNKVTPQKTKVTRKKLVQKKLSEVVKNNIDTNLNQKQERVRRLRNPVKYKEDTLSPKVESPEKKSTNTERRKILKANSSFRILEEKKSKNGEQDIYEFTFDPSEEPAPQKKKRKKVTTRKPTKPKTRVYNNNYEKNIARALADLKNVVTKQKPDSQTATKTTNSVHSGTQQASNKTVVSAPNPSSTVISTVAEIHPDYEQNKARALTDLKNVVTKQKPDSQTATKTSNSVQPGNNVMQPANNKTTVSAPNPSSTVISTVAEIHPDYEKNKARALTDLKNVVTKQKPDSQTATKTSNSVQTGNNVMQQASNKTVVSAPNPSSTVISTVAEIHPDSEKNKARALTDLKNVVSKQNPESETATKISNTVQPGNVMQQASNETAAPNPSSIVISTVAEIHPDPAQNTSVRSNVSTKHVSYRVEDIAADFDASMDHEINYSPVNSPHRMEPEPESCPSNTNSEYIRPDDPLNLRNDLSFFDDQPVANSSMNASKNPTATPWRIEFESLPIKWQANTYVKPDMTPALESSFVNHFDDSKKKHVYTNMVTESNMALPEIEDDAPKLKQTSIISFIKEVVEKQSNRKKRGASATPTKANSLFDMPNITSRSVATPRKETSGASNNSAENEICDNKPQKRKNNVDNNPTPAKLPRKDNENTLFGFDDSGNQDQENVSPVKVNNNRLRSLRSRSGAVLKEINKQTGPMRAELPAAMKAKLPPSSEAVEKIYDHMKSAADAPVLLDKQGDAEVTNVEMADGLEDDSQSVHLFEDIELIHHLKPTRKSYGKARKVAFQNTSDSSSETEARNQSSDDEPDNLEDLSFHLPQVKPKKATKKKKTKKQVLSKKEKAEVDAWAASFNSMCEDIEEFDLVVE